MMIITPQQSRMARAALELTIRELARQAGMSPSAVSRFESGQTLPSDRLLRLRGALEQAGIAFLAEEAAMGPGIRLVQGFGRSMIVDRDGKHVAAIVGAMVHEVADDRAVATVQDGTLYALSGEALGALRPANMVHGTGSLPELALDRLKATILPSAEAMFLARGADLLERGQDSSDSPT